MSIDSSKKHEAVKDETNKSSKLEEIKIETPNVDSEKEEKVDTIKVDELKTPDNQTKQADTKTSNNYIPPAPPINLPPVVIEESSKKQVIKEDKKEPLIEGSQKGKQEIEEIDHMLTQENKQTTLPPMTTEPPQPPPSTAALDLTDLDLALESLNLDAQITSLVTEENDVVPNKVETLALETAVTSFTNVPPNDSDVNDMLKDLLEFTHDDDPLAIIEV